MARELMIYNDEGEGERLPVKWEICSHCEGEGRSSSYLGAFTQDEAQEDPEFFEDYMAGHYDRACDCCGGSGKIAVPNYKRMTPSQIEAWEKQKAEADADQAENDAERRAELYMDCRMAGANYWDQ